MIANKQTIEQQESHKEVKKKKKKIKSNQINKYMKNKKSVLTQGCCS